MTLADIRKLTIKQQYRVHFRLRNGLECIVNETGVAQVPELKRPPDFNLEEELTSAEEFLLEPVVVAAKNAPPKPRKISRAELSSMMATPTAAAAHDPDHDDD